MVSIVIPVYGGDRTLPTVLSALRGQVGPGVEVVVVDSSGLEHAAELERTYPWLRVIGLADRALPGRARNIGARSTRGSRLVFLDADAVPGPTWLRALQARQDASGRPAVAGAVHNGTAGDTIGTASYFLEFSEWLPQRQHAPLHGASCNLLIERQAFEAAGGFFEDLWPGEDTVLTVPFGLADGLAFAADAPVWHINRTGFVELLRHQYRLGRSFAAVCERSDFPHAQFSRWPLLTVAPILRLGALVRRLSHQPELLRAAARAGGPLLIGLVAWTLGVASVATSRSRAG